MFTGIIEEIGKLAEIKSDNAEKKLRLKISASKTLNGLKIGSSINVNGACQTVVGIQKNFFEVDTIEETLKKTNLGDLALGDLINLERPLKVNDRLDGHFILGHIDTTGEISRIKKLSGSYEIEIKYPEEFSKFLVNVGSVAVEGISLTVSQLTDSFFSVAIIPHTWKETNLSHKKSGDRVNLEFDILGKYAAKLLNKSF